MSKRVEEQKEKVMTKYDRKMEARREAAIQEAKEKRNIKIGAIALVAALVIAAVGSIAYSIYQDKAAVSKAYVKVGDMEFTRQDYDFFYAKTVEQFLSDYSDLVSFMGIDFSVPFDQQQYTEEYTWDDQFDTMTAATLEYIAVLYQDGQANAFEYDATEALDTFTSEIEAAIEEKSMTRDAYYKASFGDYADEAVIYELEEMYVYAYAYADYLKTIEVVDDAEIQGKYDANPNAYDKVDYYSYSAIVETEKDATDEEKEQAAEQSKATAETFLERLNAGEDFGELATELSPERYAALYKEHGGLFEDVSYGGALEHTADWLFDTARKADDQTMIFNEGAQNYNVLVFVGRERPATADETIKAEIIDARVVDYIATLTDAVEFEDVYAGLNLIPATE